MACGHVCTAVTRPAPRRLRHLLTARPGSRLCLAAARLPHDQTEIAVFTPQGGRMGSRKTSGWLPRTRQTLHKRQAASRIRPLRRRSGHAFGSARRSAVTSGHLSATRGSARMSWVLRDTRRNVLSCQHQRGVRSRVRKTSSVVRTSSTLSPTRSHPASTARSQTSKRHGET